MKACACDTTETRPRAGRAGTLKLTMIIVSVVVLVWAAMVIGPTRPTVDEGDNGHQLAVNGPTAQPPKLVFAHYLPPFPISIDNVDPMADYYTRQYLNPDGEGEAHSAYGGLLRDRPLPRPPRLRPDWRTIDLATEIEQASSIGIDGFSVDILATHSSKNWIAPIPTMMLQTAEKMAKPFKILLMPDMDGELGKLSPQQLASEIALLAKSRAAFRLADGRLVVAPYHAENRPVSWWTDFLAAMKGQYGTNVALLPVFLDVDAALIKEFSPITFGMSEWGARNPAFNPTSGFPLYTVRSVNEHHQLWMQPVSFQDFRPRDQIYDEAENTTNFRNTWQIAIDGKAQWVQIVTWNDYAENTSIAPSPRHGSALLDIASYYISYFKSGTPPPITKERLFLTHRTQLADAIPTSQTDLAMLRNGSTPSRDTVETLSFLAAPAVITINVAQWKTICHAPAGVSTCTAPLRPKDAQASWTVSADVSRDGRSIIDLVSPDEVVANPRVQDLSYAASEAEAASG